MLAVLAIAASDASDFSLKLLFTGELRGAMYPVDKRQNECSAGRYNETPCECFGGAARRHAAFAAARDSPDSARSERATSAARDCRVSCRHTAWDVVG